MTISDLRDIRKRTREYINEHVELEIEILPEDGDEIFVGDTFETRIKIKNSPNDPTKRIRLKKLVFRLHSPNISKALLRAPGPVDGWEMVAPLVPAGTHLEQMFIKPTDPKDNILGVFGKSATLRLPPIPGNPAIERGTPQIRVGIASAEPDLEFLFPIVDGGDTSTEFVIKE